MAGPENDPVKENPQAPKEATPAGAPATKYVGTPAVGTSKAAAASGPSIIIAITIPATKSFASNRGPATTRSRRS